ncbi:hypothetical protein BDV59DRAFT_181136, partial [Aspergillus ambiguus]|uniref:uncharacterized protein n=1 Tax=Aspergillus ambiguus TaxID=176160 RepID=UPI003CCD6499
MPCLWKKKKKPGGVFGLRCRYPTDPDFATLLCSLALSGSPPCASFSLQPRDRNPISSLLHLDFSGPSLTPCLNRDTYIAIL